MTDWQTQLTAQVARTIETRRTHLGLSRTELAARCTREGLPTKRPALTALLDGRRRTITLQELVVLARCLDISVAELVVPLHGRGPALGGPSDSGHPFEIARRLFRIPIDPGEAGPYRLFLRHQRASSRFLRANQRLASLSHALAVGAAEPTAVDGHPHPAAEILATEAALSRLRDATRDLEDRGLSTPPSGLGDYELLDEIHEEVKVPVIGVLNDLPSVLPLFIWTVRTGQLPAARLLTGR